MTEELKTTEEEVVATEVALDADAPKKRVKKLKLYSLSWRNEKLPSQLSY